MLSGFALSCSFRLLLAFNAGLFVMLSLSELREYTASCTLSLKSAECAVYRFIILNNDFCHLVIPPSVIGKGDKISLLSLYNKKVNVVNSYFAIKRHIYEKTFLCPLLNYNVDNFAGYADLLDYGLTLDERLDSVVCLCRGNSIILAHICGKVYGKLELSANLNGNFNS